MAFTDVLGQYMDNRMNSLEDRFNAAGQYFTDPAAALENRLLTGNTMEDEEERKRRERERQLREMLAQEQAQAQAQQAQAAAPAQAPEQPAMPAPQAPAAPATVATEMAPQAVAQPMAQPVAPDQTLAETQRLAQQAAEAAQRTEQAVQAQQPAAPVAPVAPTQLAPTPGAEGEALRAMAPAQPVQPAVQVAGPAQLPPQVGPQTVAAPAVQPAPQPQPVVKDYSADLRDIANNPKALAAYIGSKEPGDPSVKIANDLYMLNMQGTVKAADAEKILGAAAQGDRQAQSQLMRDLRSEEGSYVKAILFARLGLNKLAEEEQMKLGGGKSIGRAVMDGQGYTVETNARGAITRAWDENGQRVGESTLDKINATGMKQGSHAFGFTGGQYSVPSTGEPLQARQNAITGAAEYVHMIGPKKGQVYTGTEIPMQQRVTTNAQVAYNDAQIKFATQPNITAAQELLKNAANNDTGDGREINKAKAAIADRLGPAALNQIISTAPAAVTGGGVVGQNVQQVQTVNQAGGATTPTGKVVTQAPITSTGTAASQLIYTPSTKRSGESENMYQSRIKREEAQFNAEVQKRKELEVAEGKPPAEAKGKNVAKDINNQNFADGTYDLIKPIANLIKQSTGSGVGAKVDSLAAAIGASPSGAQAIAQLEPLVYPILANVPRFEGAQSEYDVKTYQKAAGDFANPEKPIATRLAALQGMITLLKKYDKAGKNDWTFGEGQPGGGQIRIIKREKVQ